MALSDDEFELLMRLLKLAILKSNTPDQPGYNQCTKEWEKELKREQPGGVAVNGLMIFNANYENENLCWRSEDRLPKTGATGRQE